MSWEPFWALEVYKKALNSESQDVSVTELHFARRAKNCQPRWPRGDRLLVGTAGSNPAGGMDVWLLSVLYVVR